MMTRRARTRSSFVVLFACGVPAVAAFARAPSAQAQSAHDPAAAAELFRRGREAVAKGDLAGACPTFAESARLDPRVGTLINLAQCEEGTMHLASARQHWQEANARAQAQGDDRAPFTAQRLAAIDPRVPRLVVTLAPATPSDAVVRRDDVDLGAASLGVPIPVEIGPHAIVASAPGHVARAFELTVAEGEVKEIVVSPGAAIPAPAPELATPEPQPPARAKVVTPWRTVSIATAGIGLVAAGVGTYFGVRALSNRSGAPGTCTGDVCDPVGTQVRRGAVSDGNVSTGFFIGAGALLGGAVVTWLVGAPRSSAAIRAGLTTERGGAGLEVVGQW